MKDVIILDCPEVKCPKVLLIVFDELCGVFIRHGHSVRICNSISEIQGEPIVFMGNSFQMANLSLILYKQCPNAHYYGWYWQDIPYTTLLPNFTHIYENVMFDLNTLLPDKIRIMKYMNSIPNKCPLLLRANEDPKKVGRYERKPKRHYCYMGCVYCPELVPDENFTGIYYATYNHDEYLNYDQRKHIYLTSTFALGFQSDENILNGHVSQRIYEGLAYGCIVFSNSKIASEQTEGNVIYVESKIDIETQMRYFLDSPDLITKKQKEGYDFIRRLGTNEMSYNNFNE
jgi:hypothetical protein